MVSPKEQAQKVETVAEGETTINPLKGVVDMLDPQVQIRIIDLAWQWAKETLQRLPGPKAQQTRIEARAVGFDQAYKAILKTISEG